MTAGFGLLAGYGAGVGRDTTEQSVGCVVYYVLSCVVLHEYVVLLDNCKHPKPEVVENIGADVTLPEITRQIWRAGPAFAAAGLLDAAREMQGGISVIQISVIQSVSHNRRFFHNLTFACYSDLWASLR